MRIRMVEASHGLVSLPPAKTCIHFSSSASFNTKAQGREKRTYMRFPKGEDEDEEGKAV